MTLNEEMPFRLRAPLSLLSEFVFNTAVALNDFEGRPDVTPINSPSGLKQKYRL